MRSEIEAYNRGHNAAVVGDYPQPSAPTPTEKLIALLHDPEAHRLSNPVVSARMLEAADALSTLTARVEAAVRERDAAREQTREAYRACSARARELDEVDRQYFDYVTATFEHRYALAEVLGVLDEDQMPPEWPKMIARVNELRTTLRARRALAAAAREEGEHD